MTFTGRDGRPQHPYATSWGATTRLVGGVVMAHGDDAGLRLPPAVAPHQVVIVPIVREEDRADVLAAAAAVAADLRSAGIRVRLDDREGYRPGFKFHEWELKGVPCRVEIGARDLAAGAVTVARRDTGARITVAPAALAEELGRLLADIQRALFASALEERERRTARPGSSDEMIAYLRAASGFARAAWCGGAGCEARVKEESSASIHVLPLGEGPASSERCICCGRPRSRSPSGRRRTARSPILHAGEARIRVPGSNGQRRC